jgi:hypothetical protein
MVSTPARPESIISRVINIFVIFFLFKENSGAFTKINKNENAIVPNKDKIVFLVWVNINETR